ncbi:RNA polymerase sigma factor [Streptomyces sp. NPDC053048]|uniref:RNA polymerase sigma factor n=1 Tax=Streptomyces sp. NPDC053048 TaxID=3365694 RepID=UPI0037D516C9
MEWPGFSDFFTQEYQRVVHGLMRAGATCEEAEDAVQDAMQALLLAWPTCRNHAGWVRTTAWHAFCKRADRNRKRVELESRNARLTGPEPAVRMEPDERDRVMRVLRDLPPRQRQVLALHYDEYSAQEIAELLGVKPSTVRSNLRHAVATIRRSLERYDTKAGFVSPAGDEGKEGGSHAQAG